jgi:peptide/nickel transport system ATP-binding protein
MAKAPALGDVLKATPDQHLAACHMAQAGSGHSKAPATLAELFNI